MINLAKNDETWRIELKTLSSQKQKSAQIGVFQETGGILFREYCFGGENSLSSAANSVSSARNSVSSRLHANNRLKGTH